MRKSAILLRRTRDARAAALRHQDGRQVVVCGAVAVVVLWWGKVGVGWGWWWWAGAGRWW